MDIINIYKEINYLFPKLVEGMINRNMTESDSERQTIYGDLMDWVRDYYPSVPLYDRNTIVKLLLGSYVISHPNCLQKIYNVIQESNVDGEILINVTPCSSLEAAKKVMIDEMATIIRESHHFGGHKWVSEVEEEYEVEYTDTSFYINDPCDDYYEDIKIEEKMITR